MKLPPFISKRSNRSAGDDRPSHFSAEPAIDRQPSDELSVALAKVGDVLGKYELVGRLGRGSTSFVFLGRHRKLLFPVAVKVLEPTALAKSPGLRSQLELEAVLLAQLNHPNIVRLWDLDDDGPVPHLVLEYVAGGTVAELIADKGAIPTPFAFAIIRQVVEGLAEAYRLGIIHRDVKPGNFLLARDGHVKVADLGLAMVKCNANQRQLAEGDQIVVPAVGTAWYMAPEQASDPGGADFRADIYSLGASLYHLLTGRPPFEGGSTLEVVMKHLRLPPAPPSDLVAGVSPACAEVVLRMLAKKPGERFNSYDELRRALAQAIGDRRAPRPLAESFLSFAESKNS
jgi:eukaryotic-like serine/threonine-protein kinase